MKREYPNTVTVTKIDREFMNACDSLIPLIEANKRDDLIVACQQLRTTQQQLNHPHANGTRWLVSDIAEGCIFDYQEEFRNKMTLNSLKRSIVDFNNSKVYPAHYVLTFICLKKKGRKVLESWGGSVENLNGNLVVSCSLEPVKEVINSLTGVLSSKINDKKALQTLSASIPSAIRGWHIEQKAIQPYLYESYARLGI